MKTKSSTCFFKIVLALILCSCSHPRSSYSSALSNTPASTPGKPTMVTSPTPSNGDVGLMEQPPIETLNQNGISLSLSWVYADKFRIAVEYQITGVDIPQGYQLYCPVLSMSMKDGFGDSYDIYQYGYGDTEHLLTNCSLTPDKKFVVTHNFYLPHTTDDKEYDLAIDIIVGGMSVVAENGARTTISDYGNFYFNFKVMNNGNLTLESNESVNLNELIATLNRTEINPSFVNAYICIHYENQKGWYPKAYLLFEGNKIYADPNLTFRTDLKKIDLSNWFNQFTTNRCYRLTFPIKYKFNTENNPIKATVVLEKMEINLLDAVTQNDCDFVKTEIQKKYPGLDFLCQIDDRDGGYGVLVNILTTPAGMDLIEAQKIAEQGFVSSKDGPWIFSLLLP